MHARRTGQLGLFNQIESICALSIALVARGIVGADAIAHVHVGAVALPVVILAFVSVTALAPSSVTPERHRNRVVAVRRRGNRDVMRRRMRSALSTVPLAAASCPR
jgi:hypothetical protein